MKTSAAIIATAAAGLWLAGCGDASNDESAPAAPAADEGTHTHADGSTHADHADEAPAEEMGHAHDETSLGTAMVGGMEVELAQGHGPVRPGQESHLVVKLPYSDDGATVVRAWIGTEDRTLSFVGMGEYAPSHDDYDVHAMAPEPLPDDAMWWIEIEKPDGTTAIGSAAPMRE